MIILFLYIYFIIVLMLCCDAVFVYLYSKCLYMYFTVYVFLFLTSWPRDYRWKLALASSGFFLNNVYQFFPFERNLIKV